MSGTIKVTLVRSLISEPQKTRRLIKALGLRKIGSVKVHKDNNCIRGMLNKAKHMVSYELVSE